MANQTQQRGPMLLMNDKDFSQKLRSNVTRFRKVSESSHTQSLVSAESELRFAFDRLMADSKFKECDPDSISRAFLAVSNIGLSLNPALQYATFIPTWSRDRQLYECALWVMYRGFIKLATDTGIVRSVKAESVFSADDFQMWDESGVAGYKHIPNVKEKRNTEDNFYLGTYVVAHLANPPPPYAFEWVPVEEMTKMRDSSKNYDPSKPHCVWIKWEDEMRRKSAIKRAQKYWPKSQGIAAERFAQAIHLDNILEGAIAPPSTQLPPPLDPAREQIKLISKAQNQELLELVKSSKINPERICKAYFVRDLAGIPADKFDEVKERVATFIANNKKKSENREPGEDDEK